MGGFWLARLIRSHWGTSLPDACQSCVASAFVSDHIKSEKKGGEFILHLICSSEKYPFKSYPLHPETFPPVLFLVSELVDLPYLIDFFFKLLHSQLLSPCSFCKRGCSTSCVTGVLFRESLHR